MFKEMKLWLLAMLGKAENVEEIVVEEVEVKVEEVRPKRCISYHAQERFETRHGIRFTDEQARTICDNIISKNARFVKNKPGDTEQWIAECDGKKYRVIYSPSNEMIVTVYPSTKDRSRKPSRRKNNNKKKFKGRQQKRMDRRPQPAEYKRQKRVIYEEMIP